MNTATAQAFANIAFIKYWGIVTEKIAVVTRFLHNS
jgi:mevalonate pyrophosphate decarboxylase